MVDRSFLPDKWRLFVYVLVTDVAAGGSFDWAKSKLNIAYAYSPELRPGPNASNGFDIPASNITPSGAETFAGIVATVTNAQHKV